MLLVQNHSKDVQIDLMKQYYNNAIEKLTQVATNILKVEGGCSATSSSGEGNSDSSQQQERLQQTIDSLSATLHFKDKEIHSLRIKLDEIATSKADMEKEMTALKNETNEKLNSSQQKMHIISSKNANLIQTLQERDGSLQEHVRLYAVAEAERTTYERLQQDA